MFKSRLIGKARVTFGGKIGTRIGNSKIIKQPNVIVGFQETKNIGRIGKYYKIPDEDKVIPPVSFVFTKVESIDSVITMLTQAKERLKKEIDTYEEEDGLDCLYDLDID